MDVVFIMLLVGFFALSAGLIRFCGALMDRGPVMNWLSALASRCAVEGAGDCDVPLLDKTSTITCGNRQASAIYPVAGVTAQQLAEATLLASLGDETPEGKSIVVYVEHAWDVMLPALDPGQFTIVPFPAQTRISGVTYRGRELRKGALDAVRDWITPRGGRIDVEITTRVEDVARRGSTPLVVAEGSHVLGIVELRMSSGRT